MLGPWRRKEFLKKQICHFETISSKIDKIWNSFIRVYDRSNPSFYRQHREVIFKERPVFVSTNMGRLAQFPLCPKFWSILNLNLREKNVKWNIDFYKEFIFQLSVQTEWLPSKKVHKFRCFWKKQTFRLFASVHYSVQESSHSEKCSSFFHVVETDRLYNSFSTPNLS